jgi:hypothetical protein
MSMDNIDNIETSQLPVFERAIVSADKRLRIINRQQALLAKTQKIFHTFNRAFEDIKKALPDATELEAHTDRVCFEIRDVPISIIYIPQSQPTFININRQNVLAERMFICDKYFGKNTYEMVGPSEREVSSIFITEESYLVRWLHDGKSYFYPSVYELVDSTLNIFFSICEMYKDKHGHIMEVNVEDYQHKVTPLDLLSASAGEIGLNSNSNTAPGPLNTRNKIMPGGGNKNISIYGNNSRF